MANSLLAHLYTHIRGSQEDIATISLQYILSQSSELNKAFTKRIASNLEIELDDDIQYVCQVSGKDKERPDMAGIDSTGKEQVLCEMKFYAGLTKNQPLTYIDRLKDENGKGLIFICPYKREISFWTKLKEMCISRQIEKVNDSCVRVDGINMAIMTWLEVLELLNKVASSVALECLSDIKQLEGYCTQMDSDAFIPFTSEELAAENAKRGERYYEVIDKTVELLCDDDAVETSLKGVRANAYRKGYSRSLYIDDFTISLNYDRDLWKSNSSIETPFWVAIRGKGWEQSVEMQKKFNGFADMRRDDKLWNLMWLALEPLTDATLLEVCMDLKRQILEYIDCFR